MGVSSLQVFVLVQCLSLAIGSPLDSIFDPLPSLDDTVISLDNPGILTADIEGPEDSIFFDPGGIEIGSDPTIPLFPETDPSQISFDIGIGETLGGADGGADFLLAAANECGTRERACCLRGDNDCYTAPSAQCSNQRILCCSRVDPVSRVGVDCQVAGQPTQPQPQQSPATQPQNTQDDPSEPSVEDYLDFLYGLD